MAVIDGKIFLINNDCYKQGHKMKPKGIVVHSTGANNPYIKRYVQPDDGVIGKNVNNNDWNRSGLDVCVHGFIGKDKNDMVRFYQTLPFDVCCWGVGGGSKGSYNYDPPYIQFEMCEDDLTDKSYCKKVYTKAVNVCAYLCKKYNISVDNIVSHKEAYEKGYGSDHIDPTNWWNKYGYTMNKLRKAVKAKLNGSAVIPRIRYRVKVDSGWLPSVVNLKDYAGIIGKPIKGVAVKVAKDKGVIKYRVHIKDGKWLPWVNGYDIKEPINGYAGNDKNIDAVQAVYTPSSELKKELGNLTVKYRVSPENKDYLDWQYGKTKGDNSKGYAGNGKVIDRLQMKIVKE